MDLGVATGLVFPAATQFRNPSNDKGSQPTHQDLNKASGMSTQTEPQKIQQVTSKKGTPTWEMGSFYPKQGDWTEADDLALDTNKLIKLSEGCLEFLPTPTVFHQLLLVSVLDQLRKFVKDQDLSGSVLPGPMPIRLWTGKFREPDIVYLRQERLTDLHHQPDGADLAVEIVSPGEEARECDLEVKREEYARAGIEEYWIVDPEPQVVTVLALEAESYRVQGEFTEEQTAESVLLQGFTLDVSALFSVGQSNEKKEKKS